MSGKISVVLLYNVALQVLAVLALVLLAAAYYTLAHWKQKRGRKP